MIGGVAFRLTIVVALGLQRLADDVGNFRGERTEVGECGRNRRLITQRAKGEDAAGGERDRDHRRDDE